MDLIDRQKAIDAIKELTATEPKIIYCKDCKWWDKIDDSRIGYCRAIKHCHYSTHWEIRIYRTYKEDFFCADADPKESME